MHKSLSSGPQASRRPRAGSRRDTNPDASSAALGGGGRVPGGGPQAAGSLRLVELPEAPPPRALPARHRPASGIKQTVTAPPRAGIGGLCLPLNSRKPPARGDSQQVRRGEGLTVGRGRVLGPRRASVSRSGEWGGGRADSADGLRSTGTALLSASPTWKPHARGKQTDRHSRNGRAPLARRQCSVLTSPGAGFRGLRRRPQSPPPHNGGVGFFSPSRSLRLGLVSGRGGVPRESGGGPWRGFGLCLGWRCGPGSCGYRGGGTSLSRDFCALRSPGNNPRSLTTRSGTASPDT